MLIPKQVKNQLNNIFDLNPKIVNFNNNFVAILIILIGLRSLFLFISSCISITVNTIDSRENIQELSLFSIFIGVFALIPLFALLEELVFRYFISPKTQKYTYIYISSLLFGLVHLPFVDFNVNNYGVETLILYLMQFVFQFIIGVFLCVIRVRLSFVHACAAHIIINLIQALVYHLTAINLTQTQLNMALP